MSHSVTGTIIAAFGRHYDIELSGGQRLSGLPRGKKSVYAVGDRVVLESAANPAQILRHEPRTSLLYRSDAYRQKLIAANASQLVLVVAAEPAFSDELLSRAIVAAEHEGLALVIVLNKTDLAERMPAARAVLEPFAALGYPIVEVCARGGAAPLLAHLSGEISVLVGQSGMGKSTLINALVPGAAASTREISTALASGKHTTTHARLYDLAGGGAIIDSPGLQEFGLAHLTRQEIEFGFVEFRPLLGQCRFRDCHHDGEPDCAILQAIAAGTVHPRRRQHFRQFADEAEKIRRSAAGIPDAAPR